MPVSPTAAITLASITPLGGKKKLVTNNPIENNKITQSDRTLFFAEL